MKSTNKRSPCQPPCAASVVLACTGVPDSTSFLRLPYINVWLVSTTLAAMAAGGVFESGHLDMVHDAQLDYYGKRLATCSSDRTVKVFDLSGDQRTHIADLKGHEGPVWTVCWAHPRYGSLLASASFDHRVILWKEGSDGQWIQVSLLRMLLRDLHCFAAVPMCNSSAPSSSACKPLPYA